MRFVISSVIRHAPGIKEFQLRREDGAALPAWLPGSHVILNFASYENHYSLVGSPGEAEIYRVVVQREEHGKGGSRCLHDEFDAGSPIEVHGPFNSFPLETSSHGKVLLIAGGIGITPLVSMAHALARAGRQAELHYLARDRERMVLVDELSAISGVAVFLHVSNDTGRVDLPALIGSHGAGDAIYACGPVGLLQGLASQLNWPPSAIHVESFGARVHADDQPLEVELSLTGITVSVQPGTSVLDALIAHDVFVSYECKRGECGSCYTQVLEGQPEHRDVCLTPAMRESGMCTCVSWAQPGRLVLEL